MVRKVAVAVNMVTRTVPSVHVANLRPQSGVCLSAIACSVECSGGPVVVLSAYALPSRQKQLRTTKACPAACRKRCKFALKAHGIFQLKQKLAKGLGIRVVLAYY